MNMFKPVKAKSAREYFDMLPEERKAPMKFLHAFIQKAAPKLKSTYSYNMPGYGSFTYLNHKKQKLDWPVIALASQKNYISIYVCAVDKGEYLAEKYKKELGRPARLNGRSGGVSVGRSCIRFKKIEDVNLKTLEKVIKLAAKHPGL